MPLPFLPELTVPSDWSVKFRGDDGDLNEDLLQLRNAARNRIVDVGWYPQSDTSGEFALFVFAGDFSGEKLVEFRTRDREQLLTRLHELLRES